MATADTPQLLPMFGAWNEHYFNHPARLPVSKYKPNTNPNTGAESVNNAYTAWMESQQQQQAPPPVQEENDTPQPVGWNQWLMDWSGTPPMSNTLGTKQSTPTANTQGTSFASQYTPAMMDTVYENPWTILPDVFQGIPEGSALYRQLRDMGGDPLALYNISQGSQAGSTGNSAEDFINWLAGMFGAQGQVGGNRFRANDLAQSVFGQNEFGADAETALGQILGAGDASTQMRTLYNLLRDASNVGMNPLAARGYQESIRQANDRYGEQLLSADGTNGGIQNPVSWIREFAPWLNL